MTRFARRRRIEGEGVRAALGLLDTDCTLPQPAPTRTGKERKEREERADPHPHPFHTPSKTRSLTSPENRPRQACVLHVHTSNAKKGKGRGKAPVHRWASPSRRPLFDRQGNCGGYRQGNDHVGKERTMCRMGAPKHPFPPRISPRGCGSAQGSLSSLHLPIGGEGKPFSPLQA